MESNTEVMESNTKDLKLSFNNKANFRTILDKFKDKGKSKDNIADFTNSLLTTAKQKTFNDMGVSNNTIKQLINVLNESKNCDTDCKKKRGINDSRDTLRLAIKILNGAPYYFDVSEKNYLIKKYEKAGYIDYTLKNATTEIDNYIKNEKQLNDKLQDIVKNLIDSYSYNDSYLNNTDETMKNSKYNLNDIDKKIKKYTKITNLDKRTNYFESNDIKNLRNYNFYIKILYYIILITLLFINNFFSNFAFSSNIKDNFSLNNFKYLGFLIIVLILPYILKNIIILFTNIYERFLQYMNIQQFPQSYNDLIMEDK